jgi:hypothetical protein
VRSSARLFLFLTTDDSQGEYNESLETAQLVQLAARLRRRVHRGLNKANKGSFVIFIQSSTCSVP